MDRVENFVVEIKQPPARPRCALLIPHYQNMAGLCRSIASIGTTEEMDVFIVDDGSMIKIDEEIIHNVFKAKGSIFFTYLPYNQGIALALNAGLAAIGQHYTYIARLDCNDICVPDRFSQQMAFLDQHPEVALVGSAVSFIDITGKPCYTLHLPIDTIRIRQAMHINCAFIHPTVMWRNSMVAQLGGYPQNYPMAEDFAFFWQFVAQFATANLPEVLVWAELNPKGLSISKRRQQLISRLRLQWRYFAWNRYACYGVLKTLVLMVLPYRWILAIKQKRYPV